MVSVSTEQGEATIHEQRETQAKNLKEEAANQPLVKAIMDVFPGATIDTVERDVDLPSAPVLEDDDDGDDMGEFD